MRLRVRHPAPPRPRSRSNRYTSAVPWRRLGTDGAMRRLLFQYDDGGRAAAGYRGRARDCATRALAIATGRDYEQIYRGLAMEAAAESNALPRNHPRTGLRKNTVKEYLRGIGWRWTPTMQIGSGCKVHLREGELPAGRLIVAVSKHLCAVIDGVIHDTHDCSRGARRCVYGYWTLPWAATGPLGRSTCRITR